MRNIRLRTMNDEEKQEEEDENNEALNKEKYEQGIKAYLNKEYDCHVTDVVVGRIRSVFKVTVREKVLSSWERFLHLWICSK